VRRTPPWRAPGMSVDIEGLANGVVVPQGPDDGGCRTAVVRIVSYGRAEAWGIGVSGPVTVAEECGRARPAVPRRVNFDQGVR
jgi:hypothetical protein